MAGVEWSPLPQSLTVPSNSKRAHHNTFFSGVEIRQRFMANIQGVICKETQGLKQGVQFQKKINF